MNVKKLKKNYWKPTPKFFRKLGDTLLASSTMIAGFSIYSGYEWTAMIAIGSGVIGKFLTNFTSEDDK